MMYCLDDGAGLFISACRAIDDMICMLEVELAWGNFTTLVWHHQNRIPFPCPYFQPESGKSTDMYQASFALGVAWILPVGEVSI
jgi:hypothetical protein